MTATPEQVNSVTPKGQQQTGNHTTAETEARERERPVTMDTLPSFMRAVVDEITNALSLFPLIRTKCTPEMIIQDGLKVNDRYVVIERCDAL